MTSKIHMTIFIIIFTVCPFAVYAAADPNWDWNNPNTYFDYYGNAIDTPFDAGAAVGIYMDEKPTKDGGWRLYIKRMQCSDYREVCTGGVIDEGRYPFFILYNIYTGTLRHFIYIQDSNYNGDKQHIIKTEVENTDHGLFLHEGEYAYAREKKNKSFNKSGNGLGSTSVIPAYTKKWTVFDRTISYDPSAINPFAIYKIYFDAYAKSEVKLAGDFAFRLSNDPKLAGYNGDVLSYEQNRTGDKDENIIDALMQVNSTAKKYKQNLNEAKKDLEGWAADYKAEYVATGDYRAQLHQLQAESLASLASTLTPFTYAAAAYNVYKSFKSSNTDPVITLQYGAGTMNLAGSIVNQYPKNFVAFTVHNSIPPGDTAQSLLNLKNNLGVWSLKYQPSVVVGQDFLEYESEIRSNITINPESQMILESVQVAFSTQEKFTKPANPVSLTAPMGPDYIRHNQPISIYTHINRYHNSAYEYNYYTWEANRSAARAEWPYADGFPYSTHAFTILLNQVHQKDPQIPGNNGGIAVPKPAWDYSNGQQDMKLYYVPYKYLYNEFRWSALGWNWCVTRSPNDFMIVSGDENCRDISRNNSILVYNPISLNSTWDMYSPMRNGQYFYSDVGTLYQKYRGWWSSFDPYKKEYIDINIDNLETKVLVTLRHNANGFKLVSTGNPITGKYGYCLKGVSSPGEGRVYDPDLNCYSPIQVQELRTYKTDIRRVKAVKVRENEQVLQAAKIYDVPNYYCEAKGLDASHDQLYKVTMGDGSSVTTPGSRGYNYFGVGQYDWKFSTSSSNILAQFTPSGTSKLRYWTVWIDYNQNFVFEDHEKIVETSAMGVVTSYFRAPNTAQRGRTRMRVIMSDDTILNPCFNFSRGEVEDFVVTIIN